MTREMVDALLAQYRENLGRRGHLETEIGELTGQIEQAKKTMISEAALRGIPMSDMPHGTDPGNPTERIAVSFADGHLPPQITEAEGDLRSLKDEFVQVSTKVSYVESWLKGLNDRERYIVEHQVIDGEYWKTVAQGYFYEFAEDGAKYRLKTMKDAAMAKIYRMAGAESPQNPPKTTEN